METKTKTTTMKTETKFKPEFLYQEDEIINNVLKGTDQVSERLDDMFRTVEKFLDKKLKDDELKEVALLGMSKIDELLTPTFQFPKATKEFNLEAMGILKEYKELEPLFYSIPNQFKAYPYEVKNGTAKLSKKGKEAIISQYSYYTKNEAQNNMLSKAKALTEQMNELINLGLYPEYTIEQICQKLKILRNAGSGKAFEPNYNFIKCITPEGQHNPMYRA